MTTYTQYVGELEDWEKNDGKFQGLREPSQDVVDADMKLFDALTGWSERPLALDDDTDNAWIRDVVNAAAGDTITNEAGGKQSKIDARFDLIPAEIHHMVGEVLSAGADKYGEENWLLIPVKDHIGHALNHISEFRLHGDVGDLTHAICRLYFAAHLQHDGVL